MYFKIDILSFCIVFPDLKKLIKYDQRLLCTCTNSTKVSGSSYIDTTPETLRTSNSTSVHSASCNHVPESQTSQYKKDAVTTSSNTGKYFFSHNQKLYL